MTQPPRLPALILAAGASSRMGPGRDKLMEPVGGAALLTRTLRLAAQHCDPVFAALPEAPHPRYAALPEGTRAVPVAEAAEGINASLRAGLAALPAGSPAFLLLLGDLPALEGRDIAALLAARAAHPEALIWRAATEDGKPGHPVIFSAALYPQIAALRGDDGARAVVQAAAGRVHLTPLPGQRARLDLDTPEAWAAWRRDNPTL